MNIFSSHLTDPANWEGPAGIWNLLLQQLAPIPPLSVAIAAVIAIPARHFHRSHPAVVRSSSSVRVMLLGLHPYAGSAGSCRSVAGRGGRSAIIGVLAVARVATHSHRNRGGRTCSAS